MPTPPQIAASQPGPAWRDTEQTAKAGTTGPAPLGGPSLDAVLEPPKARDALGMPASFPGGYSDNTARPIGPPSGR
jgi:hypothetical protein